MLKGNFKFKRNRSDFFERFGNLFFYVFIILVALFSVYFGFSPLGGYPSTSEMVKDSFFSTSK